MNEVDTRIRELAGRIERANQAYWVHDCPIMTDPEYDQLVEELRTLCPYHPLLTEIGKLSGDIEKIDHDTPMLSLAKAYEPETVAGWVESVGLTQDVMVSPKLDGLALSLVYRDGVLVYAATRGNGETGDDVSHTAPYVNGVRVQLPQEGVYVEVRGEVVMPSAVFRDNYSREFSSPRNLAAGTLKMREPDPRRLGRCRFYVYDVLGTRYTNQVEKFAFLTGLGLTPIPYRLHTAESLLDPDRFTDIIRGQLDTSESMDVEADGVVFRVTDTELYDSLGNTAHHPRGALAWKFQGIKAKTTVKRIVWQPSRTGNVNPVACVKPVSVEHAVISRVSLHNMNIVRSLDVRIGSRVEVSRRGGVIPHIESVKNSSGTRHVKVPETCPGCGAPCTENSSGFVNAQHRLRCPPVLTSRYLNFIDAIGLLGLGEVHVKDLVNRGLLTADPTFSDLFRLRVEDLRDTTGDANAEKIIRRLAELVPVPLETLLAALGIPHVGRVMARNLAREFETLDRLMNASEVDFESLHGIGSKVANALVSAFSELRPVIHNLDGYYEDGQVTVKKSLPLDGKRFCFTGKLQDLNRKEAEAAILDLGGVVTSTVNTDLDYLVVSAGQAVLVSRGGPIGRPSSKLKKWLKLNEELGSEFRSQILGENRLRLMLEAGDDQEPTDR